MYERYMNRTLVLIALLALGCDDSNRPCADTVRVIQGSWIEPQGQTCPHPSHTMKTEQIGLTRSTVKVTCTCPHAP